MKKFMVLCVCSAFLTFAGYAQVQPETQQKDQTQKPSKQDRDEWNKKVKTELNLTADQAAKYDALCTEYDAKIDAVLSDASISKDVQKEKKMGLKKEKETKMAEFLTPEQQTKYKEIMDKKKKEMESKTGA